MEEIKGNLITVNTLKKDLTELGVKEGMTLIVHSSFKSLGQWVLGGPVSVILALEEVVGKSGTLVMPTHSGDLSDPSGWMNPPVPAAWWEGIREEMPPYDPDLTPPFAMGIIPEIFRKQREVLRSGHPQGSFAAWGAQAEFITSNHSLSSIFGEGSPIARIYDLSGYVLLLGVGNENNTSLHLSECRATYPSKEKVLNKAPMMVEGVKQWVEFSDIAYDSDDFEELGAAFEKDTGLVKRGMVAGAGSLLIPQRELIDYGVKWLQRNRK